MPERCLWAENEVDRPYHDEEWGAPVHDDRKMFEFLCLEAFQCGLSWNLILQRREALRTAFLDFDPKAVASLKEEDVPSILKVPGMIRSPQKVKALLKNAQAFLKVQEEFGSFSSYLWGFTENKTILYEGHEKGRIPASNGLSRKISKDLKKRGFSYLGPTVVYSHLQAAGLINDHAETCFRYSYINSHYPTIKKKRWGEKGPFIG